MGKKTTSNIISFDTQLPIDYLSRKFLIAHGAPVIPKEFYQSAKTAEELVESAQKAAPLFLSEMNSVRRELGLTRLINPGLKTAARIQQKADAEKDGDISKIFDPLRIAFEVDSPSKIKKAIDFFTPAKNSRVVALADQFATPDKESGMRRAKIIYQTPEVFAEIQIWHKGMMDAFENTHKHYQTQRVIKSTLMTSAYALLAYGTCNRLQGKEFLLAESRRETHNTAAQNAGLDKLEQKRTFGQIGPIPFVAIKRPIDDFPSFLRPDPCSGTYVEDNALSSAYFAGKFKTTTRDAFIVASHHLVANHGHETQPRAIRNTLNLDRA